jgi:hypothetical protein
MITKIKNIAIGLTLISFLGYYLYHNAIIVNDLKNRGLCVSGIQVSNSFLPTKNKSRYIEYVVYGRKYKLSILGSGKNGGKYNIIYDSLNPSTAIIVDTCIGNYRKNITFWTVYNSR